MGELGSLGWVAVVNGMIWAGLAWYVWRLSRESGKISRAGERDET